MTGGENTSALKITLVWAILLCVFCCPEYEDPLDEVKAFQPDDKYFKASLRTMHFVRETAAISRVDSIYHQIIGHFNLPVDASGCADGRFTGQSPRDAYDYRATAHISIENDKIIRVEYDEIQRDGHGKRGDEAYNEEMRVMGTTPKEAYPVYEKQLLDKQSILDIDSLSGASYSNYRFRYAVMIALIKTRLANQ